VILKSTLRALLLAVLCTSLMACASGRAHDNFKNRMQRQVGRSADDPNTSINRYPENRGPSKTLSNGNIEQQYHFRPGCEVYFEIDKAMRKIVGWRHEGAQEDCVLVP
jgi:hypothetical protein